MRKVMLCLSFVMASAPAFAAPGYSVTVLGRDYQVFGLNNAGTGVGNSTCCGALAQTFSRDGVSAVGLPASITESYAYGINDANTIVGKAGGFPSGHAFMFQDGVYTELAFKGTSSTGQDINNAGTVLVNYGGQASIPGSYLWSRNGGVVDLGGLSAGGPAEAVGINDRGQVAGKALAADGSFHAFIWEGGTMTDLSSFGVSGITNVTGISERGDVFGNVFGDTGASAWVYRDGGVDWYADLGQIRTIDAAGRIFGLDKQGSAVIVDGATTTYISDLIQGEPGWTIQLDAVNQNGDILSSACRNGDCGYTVLLSAVPEPSTYAMLLLGGLAACGYARRRRG